MNRISNFVFFNSPKPNCKLSIDVQPHKNFLILTGYNGSGKSRILNIIHESLSLVRDHNFPGPVMNWASEIYFKDNFRIRSIKLISEYKISNTTNTKIATLVKKPINIMELYNRSTKLLTKKDELSSSKSESEDDTEGYAWSALQIEKDTVTQPSLSSIETVFYIDEKIHFNSKKKVVDTVFEGKQGIDQVLYILFNELIAKIAINSGVGDKIKELFNLFISKREDWNLEDAKLFVSQNLGEPDFLSVGNPIESTEAFLELNKFFAMTNRKLVWREQSTFMEIGSNHINWIEFSKGEKTLITLILISYLYKETAIFLFDEPDLSLHMEWQKMLLPALKTIAPDAQFIISTHSPFMVMNTDSEQIVNMAKLYQEADND